MVNEILRQKTAGDAQKWSDFAILFRTNIQSRALEEQLRRLHIPYRLVGEKSFFDRREIKDVLAYLNCLKNADDDTSLLRIINTPPRGIGNTTVERALQFSIDNQSSLFEAIGNDGYLGNCKPNIRAALVAFRQMLDEYETKMLAVHAEFSAVAKQWIDEIGYIDDLRRSCANESEASVRERNVYEFLDDLKRFQQRRPGQPLTEFLDEITLDQDREERNEKEKDPEKMKDAVTLITLHAAKGLEFPNVYLVGLEEGILPHDRSRMEGTVDEERRLLYVGITRARKQLCLSYALTRRKYGSVESRKPSSFITELSQDFIEHIDSHVVLNAPVEETSAKGYFSRMRDMLGANP